MWNIDITLENRYPMLVRRESQMLKNADQRTKQIRRPEAINNKAVNDNGVDLSLYCNT